MKPSIIKGRELRKNSTDAERVLWRHLRLRQVNGERFRRQRSIGNYIVDFVCLEKGVVIEVDGGQHAEGADRDARRDEWLRAQGFVVLRFWNHEVLTQIEDVKEAVWRALNEALLVPPPQAGEEIFDALMNANLIWSLT